jgi:hypothetical protein
LEKFECLCDFYEIGFYDRGPVFNVSNLLERIAKIGYHRIPLSSLLVELDGVLFELFCFLAIQKWIWLVSEPMAELKKGVLRVVSAMGYQLILVQSSFGWQTRVLRLD